MTAFPKRVLLGVGGPSPAQVEDIRFTNNLVTAGQFGINPTGSPCNIGGRRDATTMLRNCWKSFEFKNNVIIDGGGGWPPDNFHAKSFEAAGLEKLESRGGTVFRLASQSKFKEKGTDGKDVGADLDAINKAVDGVY